MPFKFPYTNFQELNLDWIIKKVKDLSKQIEDDSSIVSEYIDRLIAVEDKADNAEATATDADARATGANNTANSALTLATQAKQTAEIADLSATLLGLKIGDLSSLYTTAKDTIVNAINEVWSIFHNATAVTNVTPAGSDPAVTYSNGVFTFDLPEGGDPDAVTHAELDAAIDDVEDRIDGLEDSIDDLSEALDNKADVIIDTASGDIASFPDGTATPLKSLIVNVEPVQAGTGDPSPSNIRPISGRAGCKVNVTGKNMLPDVYSSGNSYTVNGITYTNTNGIIKVTGTPTGNAYYIMFPNTDGQRLSLKAGTYTISCAETTANCIVNFNVNGVGLNVLNNNQHSYTFTASNDTEMFANILTNGNSAVDLTLHIQLETGSTATAFKEYSGNSYTVTWGDEFFGGVVDVVSGKKVKEIAKIVLNGTQNALIVNWRPTANSVGAVFPYSLTNNKVLTVDVLLPNIKANYLKTVTYGDAFNGSEDAAISAVATASGVSIYGICIRIPDPSITTQTLLTEYLSANPLEVCYELATSEITSITPTPVNALEGYNNIWSDAGSVDVTYRADTKGYIDKLIAQVQALALGG